MIPTLLQYQQGNDVSPAPEGFTRITNPINPNLRSGSRLQHFPEDIYDKSAESHLIRLLKSLIGDSGVGGAQKQMLLTRLQQSMAGTHFFDLDSFYGSLFGHTRRGENEVLTNNPYSEIISIEDWDEARLRDGSYRARVVRMAQAIHLGATSLGVRKFAEALTGFEFDIIEDWQFGSYMQHYWEDWESSDWTSMEDYSWDELEFSETATNERIRNVVTLYPSRKMTEGERYDLERSIDKIKPANMIVVISNEVPDVDITTIQFSASSPSEKWEIRQLVQNKRINGILPYPDYPEDEFISPPVPAWSGYSGEAWSVFDRNPKALAYVTQSDVNVEVQIDPQASDLAPQALLVNTGGAQTVSLPEYIMKPIQGLYGGRSASDGIVITNPYANRIGDQTGLFLDKIPYQFVSDTVEPTTRLATRFWTSPSRKIDDATNEIVELRFDEPVNFNHISFQYAKFPCTIEMQYWDRGLGAWQVIDSVIEKESIPAAFGNTPPEDAVHPFHYGEGHWEKRSFDFTAVTSRFVRFVFKRTEGTPPVGLNAQDGIAYPVGMRDLDVGFRVNSNTKVPHVPGLSAVATSRNIAGLQTRYYLERARADLVEDALPTAWISEPQPIKDAVVPMYLSVGDGVFPQVINQLYLDPVHVGPIVNLYTTRETPVGLTNAEPRDDVVIPSIVVGSVNPVLGGNQGLTLGKAEPAYVDIDATPLGGGSTGGAFWIGSSWEFTGFDVGDHFGKFTTIVSTALPSGYLAISHGLSTILAGGIRQVNAYTIFVTINGQVLKLEFPQGTVPAASESLRLVVSANANPVAFAKIGDGDVVTATIINPDDSKALSSTYNPRLDRRPPDWYENEARDLPLALRAVDFNGGADWVGIGSDSTLSANTGDAVFLGNRLNVNEWFVYLPGQAANEGNSMSIPYEAGFSVISTGELFYGAARIQPLAWNDGTERYVMGFLPLNSATATGWGFGLNGNGRLSFIWGNGVSQFEANATSDIQHDVVDPIDVSFTIDGSTLRFFYKRIESARWLQLGLDIDLDAIQGTTFAVADHGAQDFSLGSGGLSGGTNTARVFHGGLYGAEWGVGTPSLGADFDAFRAGVEFSFNAEDIKASRRSGIEVDSFTSTTDQVVTVTADDQANTICPAMILAGPGIILQNESDSAGITISDQVGNLGFDKWFTAAGLFHIPFADAGRWPLLTKRNGNTSTDKGWGVYVDDGTIVFEASDGVSEVVLTAVNPYLTLDGVSGSYLSSPNDPGLDLSEGLDVVARVSLDDWTPVGPQTIASSQEGWQFAFNPGTGALQLGLTIGTVQYLPYTNITPPADGETIWVRATHDSTDGTTAFYTAPDQANEPTEDEWVYAGPLTGGFAPAGVLDGSASAFLVGAETPTLNNLDGNIYALYVRDHRGDIVFETDAGDIPTSGTSYTASTGQTVTLNGGVSLSSWSVAPTSTSTGGFGSPISFAVETLPSAARMAARLLDSQPNGHFVENTATWANLISFENSAPVRILSDNSVRTPGVVYSVYVGSGEQRSIESFTNTAGSIARAGTTAAIGSSWVITDTGLLEDGTPVVRGDVIFEQPLRTINEFGSIDSAGENKALSRGGTVRYGSPVRLGSYLKLMGSAVGYGFGPGQEYLDTPDLFNVIPFSNDTTYTRGTFLRYHPSYFGWTNGDTPSIGFMGGQPDSWAGALWEPVGQFVLTRGNINFPDILSKGLKLEFTDLAPEPYESFLPINREVSRLAGITPEELGRSQDQISRRIINLLTVNRFSDSIRPIFYDQDPRVNLVSPTAGLAIKDGTIKDQLGERYGFGFNYQAWQNQYRGGMNVVSGIHEYNVTQVQSVSRTAFFVGLRTLSVRRVRQQGQFDNSVYWDTFYDADNVDVPNTTFEVEPGQLYTPEFNTTSIMQFERKSQSKPYYSRTPITAVQFATQQTPSVQIVPDDEFRSPDLVSYDYESENRWNRQGDSIVFWDQAFGTVRVTRDPAVLDAFYAPDTPIVHPPVTPVLSSGFARVIQIDDASTGGISSPFVSVSPKGVVWVAARVAAYNELSAPLWLRVYDGAGAVIAQKSFTPQVGFPTEVTLALTSAKTDTYGIQVRVEQDGPYYDSWLMYALSAFDQSILWEFSNDGGATWMPGYTARNLRYGVVDFPRPGGALMWRVTAYRYNAIVDAIQMRPWYQNRMGAPL